MVEGTVARIDPTSERTVADIGVGTGPSALAIGAGSVWVTKGDGTVARIQT